MCLYLFIDLVTELAGLWPVRSLYLSYLIGAISGLLLELLESCRYLIVQLVKLRDGTFIWLFCRMCLLKTILYLNFILTLIIYAVFVFFLNLLFKCCRFALRDGLDISCLVIVFIGLLRLVLFLCEGNGDGLWELLSGTFKLYVLLVNLMLIFRFFHFPFLLWFLNYFGRCLQVCFKAERAFFHWAVFL